MATKKQTSKRASKPRPKDLPLAAAKSGRVKGGSFLSSIGKTISGGISAPFKTTAT